MTETIMSKMTPHNPRRGEVWKINLHPTSGSETQKILSAVVINSDALERLTRRLVVPITTWNEHFSEIIWIVPIKPTYYNDLAMTLAANTTEGQWVEIRDFISKQGCLSAPLMQEIVEAIAAITEFK